MQLEHMPTNSPMTNLTETKNPESKQDDDLQIQYAQRLATVGTLAGGIAHDFNNLLQVVQGNAELLQLSKNLKPEDYRRLRDIKKAARRGAEIIRHLLAFSGKLECKLSPVNLSFEVKNTFSMLEGILPENIKVVLDLTDDCGLINADTSHVSQILFNLAINAKAAMPEGGQLIVQTRNLFVDDEFCRRFAFPKSGGYVFLSMSDTGCGMDESVLKHVFDPFYTTAGRSVKQGLGLSVVYGLVKKNGGHLTCSSAPGEGTTFSIYFQERLSSPDQL